MLASSGHNDTSIPLLIFNLASNRATRELIILSLAVDHILFRDGGRGVPGLEGLSYACSFSFQLEGASGHLFWRTTCPQHTSLFFLHLSNNHDICKGKMPLTRVNNAKTIYNKLAIHTKKIITWMRGARNPTNFP